MTKIGVDARGDGTWRGRGKRIYGRWLEVRSFLTGLRIAWVSTASAAIGFLLFLVAAAAQDILLEVNYDDGWKNLYSWTWFYLLVILFWALPVFVSARWILTRFEEGSTRHPNVEPVPPWVRAVVPAFLAALCFVAILTGQLMALRTAPSNFDNAQELITEAERDVGNDKQLRARISTCGREFNFNSCTAIVSSLAIVVGHSMGGRSSVPNYALIIGCLLAFWFYIARPAAPSSLRYVRIARRTVIAVIAYIAVTTAYILLVVGAAFVLGAGLPSMPVVSTPPLLAIFAIVWLAWQQRERFLWWLGTLCGVAGATVVVFAFYGIFELERKAQFGLAHLLWLPYVTLVAAVIAWWGLSRPPRGQPTRIGRLLLRLAGAKGELSDEVATARLVNPIFYVLVGVTVALNVIFIWVEPLEVTEHVNRARLLPVVLGLPVAILTLLTYGSARSKIPLVLVAILCVGAFGMLRGSFGDDYYEVRPAQLSIPRQTLHDAVNQWAKVNDCRLRKLPKQQELEAAQDPSKELCRAPIIVAAAGGASRAAFHVAGVIGKLMDGEKFSPLAGHKGIVYSAAFNHDRSLIVTASLDNTARIWDGKTGTLINVLGRPGVLSRLLRRPTGGHTARVQSAAFSPDGKRIVTASWDGTAKIWDISDLKDTRVLTTLSHKTDVNSAAFSPDGKLIVTGSDDGGARIWDWERQTDKPRAELPVHKHYVYGVAFSPDGKRVVTASWDRTAKIWDVSDLDAIKEPRTLPHKSSVNSAAFNPDGKLVVTGSHDGKARIWDTETGNEWELLAAHKDPAHKDRIYSVAFSPDGKRVVTASWDRSAKIWDVSNLGEIKLLRTLMGHKDKVNSAAFSPDGRLVITASEDQTARTWDAETGKRPVWAEAEQYRPFGKQLFAISAVSGGALGAAVVHAALADSQRKLGEATQPPCNQEAFNDHDWFAAKREVLEPSEDATKSWKACLQLLVAGDFLSPVFVGLTRDPLPLARDDRATLLERAWEERYHRFTEGPKAEGDSKVATLGKPLADVRRDIPDKGWLPILLLNGTSVEDGRRIVTSDIDVSLEPGEVIDRVFEDTHDFHKLRPRPNSTGHSAPVYGVAATSDGTRLITASDDNTARILDGKDGALIKVLDRRMGGHNARIQSAAFSSDGKRVVTASSDRTVKIWDISNLEHIRVLRTLPHTSVVYSAAFSPTDRRLVVTGSHDGRARIWDADTETGDVKELLPGHKTLIQGVAFSPDGKRVATASWDRTAKIWDVSTLKDVKVLRELLHPRDVNSAAFSPDGRLVATGADDGKARIWDVETGDVKELPSAHKDFVYDVAFSLDGKRVVTASGDRTAKIWDVSNLNEIKELKQLTGHKGRVNSAAFIGPDGKHVVTASTDKTVRIWDADTGRTKWTPCPNCDIALSTAVTMSARFPVISPTGRFQDRDNATRQVVDGGYYENFGATTAMELARALKQLYGLDAAVILVNNDHEVSGLECVTKDQRPQGAATSWLWSPLRTVIGTRTARGSHAAVSLCDELSTDDNTNRFAFITVAPDPKNDKMTLSVSWWMSKTVQRYLDQQLTHDINRPAFDAINAMRLKPQPKPVTLLDTMKTVAR